MWHDCPVYLYPRPALRMPWSIGTMIGIRQAVIPVFTHCMLRYLDVLGFLLSLIPSLLLAGLNLLECWLKLSAALSDLFTLRHRIQNYPSLINIEMTLFILFACCAMAKSTFSNMVTLILSLRSDCIQSNCCICVQ